MCPAHLSDESRGMAFEYIAQTLHDERAGRLRAEAEKENRARRAWRSRRFRRRDNHLPSEPSPPPVPRQRSASEAEREPVAR